MKRYSIPGVCFAALALLALLVFSSCKKDDFKSHAKIDGMAYIPSGVFYRGSLGSVEEEGQDRGDGRIGIEVGVDEVPRHKVALKGFYMDKFEVTNAQYKRFVEATGRPLPANPGHPYDKYIWKDGTYPEGKGDNPVGLVSFEDATAYCRWAGKRLPDEEEWEKACRGTDARKWPWGNAFDPAAAIANVGELDIGGTSPAGGFPADVSPYGVFDMGGNVREWTRSRYQPYPGSTLKRGQFNERFFVIKGGSWALPLIPESRCAARGFVVPEDRHRTVGFRCAKDGEE